MANNSGFPDCQVGDVITSLGNAQILSLEAQADVTKGSPVTLTDDLKVSPSTGNDDALGIALQTVTAGEQCPVCVEGVVKVTAAGAITRGTAVCSAADGKVTQLTDQPVDEGGTNTYTVYYARKLGIALCSASADGDQILILVTR